MKQKIKERIEMINRGEVPEGYRKYGIWIVPEEWTDVNFKNIFEEIIDKTSDIEKYPLYSLTIEEGVTPKTERYERSFLLKKEEDNYKVVHKNDFVYNPMNLRFGALGRHKENREVCVSAYYNIFKVNNGYNPVFIEHYLKSHRLIYLYNKYATGSLKEKQRLHFSQFKNFILPLPNQKESDEISQILSSCDKGIELKEKLIAQKKEQKKGLMQNLLTGKIKLPGFTGKWQEVKLGNILKERKETGFNDLELLAITSKNGVVRRCEIDIKDTSSDDKSKYKRICPLDIGYNTMRMWQGVSGVSKYEGIVSPAYTILTPTKNIDSYFIGYLFKLPRVINLFKRYSQGLVNDTLNLKYPNFKVIKVNIPKDISEQKAISNILIEADKEIILLNKELDALKQQKKCLMQLLLTGKVRVNS